jgi:hypothetical protein
MPFDFKTAKPAFPTQSPAGDSAPAPSSVTALGSSAPFAGPGSGDAQTTAADAKQTPLTKDPVINQLDIVQKELDTLRELLGASDVDSGPEEMEPQSDDEIVAGIPPSPKKKVAGGSVPPFGI